MSTRVEDGTVLIMITAQATLNAGARAPVTVGPRGPGTGNWRYNLGDPTDKRAHYGRVVASSPGSGGIMKATLLDRLCRAIDAHDLEGIAACFAEDYRCDIPLHPARSFTGRDQVRANWAPLLKRVPDLTATVVRQTTEGGTEWGEWEQRGTVVDGSPHLVRGVVIFTVASNLVQSARFYLEPVDERDPA